MSEHVPSVWAFALIAVASYRLWRLLAEDTILDRPRKWSLGISEWQEGDTVPSSYRRKAGEFLTCPWCLGFWVALGWWAAWLIWEEWAVFVAVPFALSAAVGVLNAIVGALTED